MDPVDSCILSVWYGASRSLTITGSVGCRTSIRFDLPQSTFYTAYVDASAPPVVGSTRSAAAKSKIPSVAKASRVAPRLPYYRLCRECESPSLRARLASTV